jgi:hypothetical protein
MCNKILRYDSNVTDLMNALPGNSSVNTVQHATTDEDVFYVVRADKRWNNGVMQPVSKQRHSKHTSPYTMTSSKNRDGVLRGVCAVCL